MLNPLHRLLRGCLAAALAAPALAAPAAPAAGDRLDERNYVRVGEALREVLGLSGLAFAATLRVAQPAAVQPLPRHAALFDPAPRVHAQVDESPCPEGGRVQAGFEDADRNGDLSAGDRVWTRFEDCRNNGSTVGGTSEFLVRTFHSEGVVQVTELDFRFSNLGTEQLRWSGMAHALLRTNLKHGTEHYRVEYRDLELTQPSRRMRWNFVLDLLKPPLGVQVARLDGELMLDALHLRLATADPLIIGPSGMPQSGGLNATDRAGARLQVDMYPDHTSHALFLARNEGDVPNAQERVDHELD